MSTPEEGPIYLSDVTRYLIRGRVLIAICTFICALSAGLYAFLSEPVYRADVLFSVVERSNASSGLGQLDVFASILGGSLARSDSSRSIATLMSRTLSREFIEQENLMQVLFADHWNREAKTWNQDIRESPPSLNDAFKLFDQKIRTISTDTKSGLITLSIEWSDPDLAAAWSVKLVDMANRRLREAAIDEATRSIAYLQAELSKTEIVEVRQAIFAVMEQQMQEIMLANVQKEYAFAVIDPPVVPERDDFVRPRRLLVIVFGLLVGLLGSSLFVVIRSKTP